MLTMHAELLYALKKPLTRSRSVVLAFLLSLLCPFSVQARYAVAESATVLEHEIKAAMLYKFLSYTDWPQDTFASEQSPYRIWVLSASSISRELNVITADRSVNDRPIEVYTATSVQQIENPHLVFVGRYAEKHLPRLAKLAEQQSFLIVTESEAGLQAGSTINLRMIDGRVGFDVSLADAQRYNLKLSARLLSVAASVDQESR